MNLVHRALVVVLALAAALPSVASAQLFLASKPHPEFAVGPLFVIANVGPDLSVAVNPGAVDSIRLLQRQHSRRPLNTLTMDEVDRREDKAAG